MTFWHRSVVNVAQSLDRFSDWVLHRLIAFDVWVMRTFFSGLPRETMSAAAWNAHLTRKFFGFTYHLIDLLFYVIERDHCRKAWEWQRELYGNKP